MKHKTTPSALINFRALSRYLADNDQSIRANKVPERYKARVKSLTELIEFWMNPPSLTDQLKEKQ